MNLEAIKSTLLEQGKSKNLFTKVLVFLKITYDFTQYHIPHKPVLKIEKGANPVLQHISGQVPIEFSLKYASPTCPLPPTCTPFP